MLGHYLMFWQRYYKKQTILSKERGSIIMEGKFTDETFKPDGGIEEDDVTVEFEEPSDVSQTDFSEVTESEDTEGTENGKKPKKKKEKKENALVSKFNELSGTQKKIGIGAGVVLLILVMVLFKACGKKENTDYFKILDNMANIENSDTAHSYEYSLDVRIKDSNEEEQELADDVATEATDATDSADAGESAEGTPEVTVDPAETNKPKSNNYSTELNDKWTNSEDTDTTEWKYPNYKVTLSGSVMADGSEKANIKIATEYFNDDFTDIIFKDDKYYINIEQMRYWLVSSKDTYLTSLGEKFPEGSKYLEVSKDSFRLPSGYAEKSELEKSGFTSIKDIRGDLIYLLRNLMSNSLNGKSASFDKSTSSSSLNTEFDLGLYKGIISSGIEKNIKTWGSEKDNSKEYDNFLDAISDALVTLSTTDSKVIFNGISRYYNSGNEAYVEETNSIYETEVNGVSYDVGIATKVSTASEEVVAPTDSIVKLDAFMNGGVNKGLVTDTIGGMVSYFNFTPVKFINKLELTPANVTKTAKEDFIKMVNSIGCCEYYLTESNLQKFIDEYANYTITENSTDGDKKCAVLCADWLDEMNKLIGGVVKTIEVENTDSEQYKTAKNSSKGLDFIANYNIKESKSNIKVVDVIIMNTNGKSVDIDLGDLSLHTLIKSKYPANNKILLSDVDSKFADKDLETKISIGKNEFKKVKLYFACNETGYMDLWYNNSNIGEVVAY